MLASDGLRGKMGTSSSHRSPSTPEWERVKQLYRKPAADPGQVSARIVSALDADTRPELSGPGVACCLTALLQASRAAADGSLHIPLGIPPLLSMSQVLREQAERAIAANGYASRFADLALNALGTATFEAASGGAASVFEASAEQATASLAAYATDHRLHDLSVCFVAHDFGHLFSYFVTRDVADFVGGEGLPTVAEASQLRDRVAAYCQHAVAKIEAATHEQALAEALQSGFEPGLGRIEAVLADLTELGLQQVAAGG